jgi:DNA-binding MarR family transcriptional regulator
MANRDESSREAQRLSRREISVCHLLYVTLAHVRRPAETELRKLELTLPQFSCMHTLSMSPGLSGADLARNANVSPQAMDRLLAGLQSRGLLVRSFTRSFGHTLPASLTDRGEELLRQAECALRTIDDRVMFGLSACEADQLTRLLGAVRTAMVTQR